jgi:hypothetical protein
VDESEAAEPGVDTFVDAVREFLLAERRLLEKEATGEPTTGERRPTSERFSLVDNLQEEHARSPMNGYRFEALLRGMAGGKTVRPAVGGGAEQRDQARQMLERWNDFRLLGQPTAQRRPYEPSE